MPEEVAAITLTAAPFQYVVITDIHIYTTNTETLSCIKTDEHCWNSNRGRTDERKYEEWKKDCEEWSNGGEWTNKT